MNPQEMQKNIVIAKHNATGRKCGKSDVPKRGQLARITWVSFDDLSTMINLGLIEQSTDINKMILTPNQFAYKVATCNANVRPGTENTVNAMFENQNDLNANGKPTVFELKSAIVRIVRDPSGDDSED